MHRDVAMDLIALVQVLLRKGQAAPAEPLARRAMTIFEALDGPASTSFSDALRHLGMVLAETERPGEAEPVLRRALAIVEHSRPEWPFGVAQTLADLGAVLVRLGRAAEAGPLLRQALKTYLASVAAGAVPFSLLRPVTAHYTEALMGLGWSKTKVVGEMNRLGTPYGFRVPKRAPAAAWAPRMVGCEPRRR